MTDMLHFRISKRYRIVVSLCLLLIACTAKRPCINNGLNPSFIGFQLAEIDTIVFRAYQPNTGNTVLIDSFLINNLNASIYTRSGDTTVVYINDSNPHHWISSGFDWQIYLPASGRSITVSDIVSTQVEGKGSQCYNPINSFVLDGQPVLATQVEGSNFYTSGYRVYIHH